MTVGVNPLYAPPVMLTALASANVTELEKRSDSDADRATLVLWNVESPDEEVAKLSARIVGGLVGYVRWTATREQGPPRQVVANHIAAVATFAWAVCPPGTNTPAGTSIL